MDVKDVGEHRPEFLVVAKPGNETYYGGRVSELQLSLPALSGAPLASSDREVVPRCSAVARPTGPLRPLARRVAVARQGGGTPASPPACSRAPEVTPGGGPARPTSPQAGGTDEDDRMRRHIQESNEAAAAERAQRRRGAALAARSAPAARAADADADEADAATPAAAPSRRARKRRELRKMRAAQQRRARASLEERETQNFVRRTAEARVPRGKEITDDLDELSDSVEVEEGRARARRTEKPEFTYACDLQLEIWEQKLKYPGLKGDASAADFGRAGQSSARRKWRRAGREPGREDEDVESPSWVFGG